MKKLFILDTNVILHDYRSIYSFEDNDIVIPITVLEELDNFKKGNNLINFEAREFMRELDRIVGDIITDQGVDLGDGRGRLYLSKGMQLSDEVKQAFPEQKNDNIILAIALEYHKKGNGKKVVLVSKDINVRMKAKALGMRAEDYNTGKVEVHAFENTVALQENMEANAVNALYKNHEGVPWQEFGFQQEPGVNQYTILRSSDNKSALSFYNKPTGMLEQVEKQTTFGITPRNAEQAFAIHALMNQDIQLVAFTGKAGTGKTLLALASAISQHKRYKQIFLARPIVALSNKDLGYLPGSAEEKINPYMQPLFDNLNVIKHQYPENSKGTEVIKDLESSKKLIIQPLAYIRGRTLSRTFFIVDEAQNLTPHEVKTIITRAGEGTKIAFTGDIHQIDSPFLDSKSNGLSYLIDKMRGQEKFAHINLVKGERSELAELASNLL